MRIWRNMMLAILIFITSIIVFSCTYYNYMIAPVSKNDELKEVVIKEGSTTSIAETLKENNLIKSVWFFKLYVKLNDVASLKASTYEFSENMGVKKIISLLEEGNSYNENEITLTFREGLNMRGITKIITENTDNTEDDVNAVLTDSAYLDELINKYWFLTSDIKNEKIYYSLEGYLFPDTYAFTDKSIDVKTIFEKMLDNMEEKLENYKKAIQKSDLTVHELITLASIVELEEASSEYRAGVAGVFYNRLEDNWSLGSDVTTFYAIKVDIGERYLYKSELNDCNDYNTRCTSFIGLPVGPICNPGLDSLKATINPEEHDYYYFVADKNEKTYFSKTSKEHNKIIQKLKDENLWYEY